MEYKKSLCHFIVILGLCTTTCIVYELIRPFISSMEYILQFVFLVSATILVMSMEYIQQFVFLVSAAILIRIRNTTNRIKGNHNTREGSNAVQNAIITRTQNHNEKANPTTKPKHQTVAIQTAKVNETNKNPRLQRDFLSTAPGKMRNRGKNSQNSPVSQAVRENIELIENDLDLKFSTLFDEMNGYLSEEDIININRSSRKDQAHLFAEIIEDYDNNTFLDVLNILNKASFGHISTALKKSYEKSLLTQLPSTLCPICRIQSEVDIKSLRCGLIKEGILPKGLRKDINNCQASRGHQNVLWQELFHHLKMMQPKQEIAKKFINILKNTKHGSIFSYLPINGLPNYNCTCDEISSIETDNFGATSSLTVGDESTTSSLEIRQEPDWYQDAVLSSGSDDRSKRTKTRSKNKHRSRFSRAKTKKVKAKRGRGPTWTTHRRCTESSDASTTPLDSYQGFIAVHVSEITPATSGIHRQQHRAVKRAMNPEDSYTAETDVINCNSEGETSDTVPKTPYHTEGCLRKRQRVLSVLPFISESDVNSDGEALKDYVLPVSDGFKINKSGEFVPMALGKKRLKKKESQTLFYIV